MTQAEYGTLGCLIEDLSNMKDCFDVLRPDMFSTDFGKKCYGEMLATYDRGGKISIAELCQKLECDNYGQEEVQKILLQCINAREIGMPIKTYSDSVQREYKSRIVKQTFETVNLRPGEIDASIAEIMARCEELQTNQKIKSKTLKKIVDENKDNYFKDTVGKDSIRTGFYNLDEVVSMEGGDVVVIGARPSVGKTAVSNQIALEVAKRGKRVGIFTLEMSYAQIYERWVASKSGISLTRIKRAKAFLGDEKEKYKDANESLSKLDITVYEGSKSVRDIRNECRNQGFDLIIIDYLQLIKADRTYSNRASEVGDISKAIKSLAMELNVPIILLSQLNRVSEHNETKEPTMAELRESGDIEQDASAIILLWNATEDRRYKGLKVDKNRQGELLTEGLKYEGDKMTFTEWHEPYYKFQEMIKNLGKSFSGSDDDSPFN